MRYHPHTPNDVTAMLEAVGRDSVDALFTSIPEDLRLHRPLRLPEPLDEASLLGELEALAAKNDVQHAPFLGAGAYQHHVPVLVDQLLLRSEFYTAYTPYQPEVSQGTLQVIFEFQTLVAQLTGAEVANASMYDGATAAAEAALMALRIGKGRRRIVLGRNLAPDYRRVVRTYLANMGAEVAEVGYGADGRIDAAALRTTLDEGAAAVIVGYPNYFGVLEDVAGLAAAAHAKGALLVTATNESLAFGLVQPPASLGADIVVGEMQSFGNGVSYGGPGLGFFACRDEHVRQMPGRLVGVTVDRDNKRGFVLTLSTREQHIRRDKATSNICTNHGLNALAASIHLALLGKTGLHALATLNYRRARYLRDRLAEKGLHRAFTGPVFNEFVVKVPNAAAAWERAKAKGYIAGLRLSDEYPDLADGLLVCVTELHSKARIDGLVDALTAA